MTDPNAAYQVPRSRDSHALAAALAPLSALLESLSPADYIAKPLGGSGSIGGHVRHVLDHSEKWVAACEQIESDRVSVLDYELRERGTDVECDLACGLAAVADQMRRISKLNAAWTRSAVDVVQMLHPDLPPVFTRSSLARELAFVISHTIHHQAIIAQIAATFDLALPNGFGYAPATLAHLRRSEA